MKTSNERTVLFTWFITIRPMSKIVKNLEMKSSYNKKVIFNYHRKCFLSFSILIAKLIFIKIFRR